MKELYIEKSNSMTYKKSLAFFFIYIILIISSCGLYSFSGASIDPNAKNIKVEYITNQADLVAPNLSNKLTQALVDKCQRETNLNITDYEEDMSFSGKITKYQISPVSIQNNEIAAQNRLTIHIEITFLNNIDGSQNFQTSFSDYADFDSNQIFSEIEDDLNNLIINNLVDDIFNAAFMNW